MNDDEIKQAMDKPSSPIRLAFNKGLIDAVQRAEPRSGFASDAEQLAYYAAYTQAKRTINRPKLRATLVVSAVITAIAIHIAVIDTTSIPIVDKVLVTIALIANASVFAGMLIYQFYDKATDFYYQFIEWLFCNDKD